MAKDTPKKPRRPRAETPKGFRDTAAAELRARAGMLARICKVYDAWGFDPLETSAVETVEALGRFLPDVDRPNEGVFAWQDEDETWLALRYDLTAPLARYYAQHRPGLPTPYRRYQAGPVWRDEKPGPGRFRQFYQCDADTVGAASVAADAQMCMMLCEALEAAGIEQGEYVVRVNNRKMLNGVMEAAGILKPHDPARFARERGIVLRAIDKLDRLGLDGVRALLGPGRRDESGDFTAGAGLAEEQIQRVTAFFQAGELATLDDPQIRVSDLHDPVHRGGHYTAAIANYCSDLMHGSAMGLEGVKETVELINLAAAQGFEHDRVILAPAVVRGLAYYTGPVFEAELTFQTLGEDGRPRVFGSVAGGGRYDDLVRRFTGEAVPATGVSIGVDRLLAALAARGRLAAAGPGPVVVTVMDRDRMAGYQAMAAELRAAGIRAEVFLGGGNMGRQLKYADQRRAPVAIIEGGDERDRGVVQLKDLALGARLAAGASREDWKAQPAQVEVPRAGLVPGVRAMLDFEG
jgi:histidyl-tRNA synthetase